MKTTIGTLASALGKLAAGKPKTMSVAAICQRKLAGKASGKARRASAMAGKRR